ncbi:MAG: restriction endonuclease subunit M [Candidatus Portiera sp.]|nr:restriction endonuclease subunit M [Portiera sp.]
MHRSNIAKRVSFDDIQLLKADANALHKFIHNNSDGGTIIYLLEKLGRLKNGESKNPLLSLLSKPNEKIRLLTIKNLSKLSDISLLPTFVKYASNDSSTEVRREAVSALGRLNNRKTIPYLIKLSRDADPKVVMQAMRGLLPFNSTKKVSEVLISLKDHPNEMIREIIISKYSKSSKLDTKTSKTHVVKVDHGFLRNKVVLGDAEKVLKHIPNESIALTFTSPPYYNARDYSIYQSYEEYLSCLNRIFKGIYKATKEGRFFILNTSPIIVPRISRSHSSKRYPIPYDLHPLLIKMGWEFIDDIVWVKPEVCVKNRNAGFLQHRKPLGYKPNAITEMLMVYRKKTDKLIDWNMKQYDSATVKKSKISGKYETSNVWKISPKFNKTHSAVFPAELCDRVISFYSYVGDLVFDPFGGSGTLGKAASALDRNFFLTEKEPNYFEYMKSVWNKEGELFNKSSNVEFMDINEFKLLIKKKNNGAG